MYDAEYNRSIQDMEKFWEDKARDVAWSKFPEKILDASDQYLHRWYPDGKMNICYNCVDRHVEEGRGAQVALSYDSAYTGDQKQYTYSDLHQHVGKLASILKSQFNV